VPGLVRRFKKRSNTSWKKGPSSRVPPLEGRVSESSYYPVQKRRRETSDQEELGGRGKGEKRTERTNFQEESNIIER